MNSSTDTASQVAPGAAPKPKAAATRTANAARSCRDEVPPRAESAASQWDRPQAASSQSPAASWRRSSASSRRGVVTAKS